MRLKVSNVCQLLPIFTRTDTDRGVTFTYSGDGSCTINGTPTGEYYSLSTITLDTKSIKPNHKYLIYDINNEPIISELIIADYQGGYIFRGIGDIYTFPEHDYTRFVFEIRVNLNQTANNIVVKPQLFDLTECTEQDTNLLPLLNSVKTSRMKCMSIVLFVGRNLAG